MYFYIRLSASIMGLILNRSIYVSIITYAGVVIGYLNLLWLYPLVMDLDEIGLFRAIQDIALLFVPFAQMGAGQGLVRYFPHAPSRQEQQQVITLSLLWTLASYLVFLLVYWLLQDWIQQLFAERAQEVNNYLGVVLVLTFIMCLQGLLEALSRSLLKFRFITFCKDILLRIIIALTLVLYFLELISFDAVLWGLIGMYGTITLAIALYLAKEGWIRLNISFTPLVRRIMEPFGRYGIITFLSSASALLVMKTDSVMITQMIGLDANGIYTIVFSIAIVVELPRRILSQISMPLLSQAFEQKNMALAGKVYQKSSLNLLLVGSLLYIGILCNMSALFNLIPQGDAFRTGAMVVILIGLGKLVDGAAGVNSEILIMSRYYRFNLYFTILMAVLNVVLNYFLIPVWGIEGAALASCLSLIIFNLIKYFFVRSKLKLQPFTMQTAMLLLIAGVSFGIGWYLPAVPHPIVDIIVRSGIITGVFAAGVLTFKVSEEATSLFRQALQIIKKVL